MKPSHLGFTLPRNKEWGKMVLLALWIVAKRGLEFSQKNGSVHKQDTQISDQKWKKFSQKFGIFYYMFSRNEAFCQILPGEQTIIGKQYLQRNVTLWYQCYSVASYQYATPQQQGLCKNPLSVAALSVRGVPQIFLRDTVMAKLSLCSIN
jgi:hypothetical protein